MTPFSYDTPVRDMTFPSGFDLSGHAWASDVDDIYVPVNNIDSFHGPNTGYVASIAHKTASGWTTEFADQDARINAVWGNAPDDVYAVGKAPLGCILHRASDGSWETLKMGNIFEQEITAMTCVSASECYVTVQHCEDATTCYPQIWQGSGSSWSTMSVPSLLNGYARQVRCTDDGECYAMGYWTSYGFLWRLNGSSWDNVAIPSDNTDVYDIGGVAGDVTIATTHALSTSDFVHWATQNVTYNAVWVPWKGAALLGGGSSLSARSLGAFGSPSSFGSGTTDITSVVPVSNAEAIVVGYNAGQRGAVRVYSLTYYQ